jgi:hypothetical protein
MAFQKKSHVDNRPKLSPLELREAKIKTLKAEGTPEARKALKKMNDVVYRGSRTNLNNWYAPKGVKHSARGKQTRKV